MHTHSLALVGNAKAGTITALYVGDETLRPTATTHVGAGCNTFAVDAARRLVHVGVEDPEPAIVTFRLEDGSGALTEISRLTVDDKLAYLSLAHDGGLLLGASYHGGWGGAWPVVDGRPGPQTSRIANANMHAAVPSPDDRHAYFVSLGDDLVAITALTADGLEPTAEPVACPKGSGPRHLIFADDTTAYLLTEYSGEAIRFERDPATGTLTPREAVAAHDESRGLNHSYIGSQPLAEHNIWGADLHLAGRWLLCSERTESTIATIPVDGGTLGRAVAFTDTETQPRGFAVSGSRVLVAGEASGHVAQYELGEDGTLVRKGRVTTGDGPNWVRFVA